MGSSGLAAVTGTSRPLPSRTSSGTGPVTGPLAASLAALSASSIARRASSASSFAASEAGSDAGGAGAAKGGTGFPVQRTAVTSAPVPASMPASSTRSASDRRRCAKTNRSSSALTPAAACAPPNTRADTGSQAHPPSSQRQEHSHTRAQNGERVHGQGAREGSGRRKGEGALAAITIRSSSPCHADRGDGLCWEQARERLTRRVVPIALPNAAPAGGQACSAQPRKQKHSQRFPAPSAHRHSLPQTRHGGVPPKGHVCGVTCAPCAPRERRKGRGKRLGGCRKNQSR